MSGFSSLTKSEILKIAEQFGVEIAPYDSKNNMIEKLVGDGVTWDEYQKFLNAEQVAPEEVDFFEPKASAPVVTGSANVLVKMERGNPYFEIYGYQFTLANPFVAMPEEDAQEIFDNETGFRIATPAELKSFYS